MRLVPGATARRRRSLLLIYIVATAAMVFAFIPIWAEFTAGPAGVEPAGESLAWDRLLLALHVITDVLIGLSYLAISGTLIYLARKAGRRIPFLWAFIAFGIFIVACGLTHFMAAITVWEPVYWLAGEIKYVTALASVGTAIAVPPLVPKVLAVVNAASVSEQRRQQLEASNRELNALTRELGDTLAGEQRTRDVLQHELASQQHDLETLAREVSVRRKEAEAAVRAREEFLSTAAHELRTPLTSVKVTGQLLERFAADSDPRVVNMVSRLNSQVDRLEDLVSDLLDAARIQQGRLELHREEFDLVALGREVFERFDLAPERSPAHELVVDVSPPVFGAWDRSRIDQVLTNLVSNALKYSPDGGTVRFTAWYEPGGAAFSVSDQGLGIAAEDRAMLFQPFARAPRTKMGASGTGLGLYICRRIVDQHGGSIDFESEPEHGATFTVRLPAQIEPAQAAG